MASRDVVNVARQPKLRKSTVELANKLIDWYLKPGEMRRKDKLEAFREAHKVKVKYETLKDLLLQLSYASIPLKDGSFDLRKVPRTHRNRVKALREEIKKGTIDPEKAKKACQKFLEHSISERFKDLTPLEDEQIRKMQERFEKSLKKASAIMADSMDAHPARTYSIIWKALGEKIHHEIPLIIKESKNEEELRENLRKLWNANYLVADAFVHYKKAESHIIDVYKNKEVFDKIPDKDLKKTVENIYKSIRRYPWGRRKSAVARESRSQFIGDYRRQTLKVQLYPEETSLPEFRKKLLLFSRHLTAGTVIYKKAMEIKEGIKPLKKAREVR